MTDPVLDVEGLIRQLRDLRPTAAMCLTYAMVETIFPPGIEDGGVRQELTALANDCFCDVRDNQADRAIVIKKRP